MKKLIVATLVFALVGMGRPLLLIAQAGVIAGVASVDGKALANVTVRLRNVDTGQLVGTVQANALGEFSFGGLAEGNFVVETVSNTGSLLATAAVTLAAGAMSATVTLSTTGTALAAAGGAGSTGVLVGGTGARVGAAAGGAAAGGGTGAVVGSTAGLLGLGASGATLLTTLVVTQIQTGSGTF
jgi:hypothetical protein